MTASRRPRAGARAQRRRPAARPRRRRRRRVRRPVRPAPGPALGGGAAHHGQPRGRRRRAAGRPDRGVPPGRLVPRRGRGHHLAAPRRRQRLPRPAARREGAPHRAAARRPRGVRRPRLPVRRPPTPADDPAEHAVAAERRRTVLAALATLPPEQRAALVLVDMEGYSVAEAAQILDCAVGTVKSRCSRGRDRLAELLGALRHRAAQTRPDGTGRRAAPAVTRATATRGTPPPARPVPPRRGGAPRWPTVPPQVPPTG